MSQQENLRIVQEIYDAVGRGDVAAILDRVTDDVDWSAEAASHAAPWYGPRTGKAGVASFFQDLADSIEITEFGSGANSVIGLAGDGAGESPAG